MTLTKSGHDVEREIASMRAYLRPSPVRIGHVPNWLRLSLLRAYGCRNRDTSGWGVLNHAVGARSWLDHYGSTRLSTGEVAFVTEPYEFGPKVALEVESLALRIGCRWYVSANSWWYPGRTTRIVLARFAGIVPIVLKPDPRA